MFLIPQVPRCYGQPRTTPLPGRRTLARLLQPHTGLEGSPQPFGLGQCRGRSPPLGLLGPGKVC